MSGKNFWFGPVVIAAAIVLLAYQGRLIAKLDKQLEQKDKQIAELEANAGKDLEKVISDHARSSGLPLDLDMSTLSDGEYLAIAKATDGECCYAIIARKQRPGIYFPHIGVYSKSTIKDSFSVKNGKIVD